MAQFQPSPQTPFAISFSHFTAFSHSSTPPRRSSPSVLRLRPPRRLSPELWMLSSCLLVSSALSSRSSSPLLLSSRRSSPLLYIYIDIWCIYIFIYIFIFDLWLWGNLSSEFLTGFARILASGLWYYNSEFVILSISNLDSLFLQLMEDWSTRLAISVSSINFCFLK